MDRRWIAVPSLLVLLSAPLSGQDAPKPFHLERIRSLGLDTAHVGRVTAFFRPGDRDRAEELAAVTERAAAFFEERLGVAFPFRMAALGPEDWSSDYAGVPYAIPTFSPVGRLILTPSSLTEGLLVRGDREADRRRIDFVTLHELGHLTARRYLWPKSTADVSPPPWFDEMTATYFAYAYVRGTDPAWARAARDEWRDAVEGFRPRKLSLDWSFMRDLPGDELARTYGWYQGLLNLEAARIYDRHGLSFLPALKDSLAWDDVGGWTTAGLAASLERIAPGFESWTHDLLNVLPQEAGDSPLARIRAMRVDSFALGHATTFYTPGHEAWARQITALAVGASRYLADSLDLTFPLRVAVLGPSQWLSWSSDHGRVTWSDGGYGMPWGWGPDRLITVPATLDEGVLLRNASDSVDPRQMQFIALHELGHVCAREYFFPNSDRRWSPIGWFSEFMASYFAYAYAREQKPELADVMLSSARRRMAGAEPRYTKLEDMHGVFARLPPREAAANYGWYQMALNLRVAEVYDRYGLDFLRRLRDVLPWDGFDRWTSDLILDRLEEIAPGFRAWARDLEAG